MLCLECVTHKRVKTSDYIDIVIFEMYTKTEIKI